LVDNEVDPAILRMDRDADAMTLVRRVDELFNRRFDFSGRLALDVRLSPGAEVDMAVLLHEVFAPDGRLVAGRRFGKLRDFDTQYVRRLDRVVRSLMNWHERGCRQFGQLFGPGSAKGAVISAMIVIAPGDWL